MKWVGVHVPKRLYTTRSNHSRTATQPHQTRHVSTGEVHSTTLTAAQPQYLQHCGQAASLVGIQEKRQGRVDAANVLLADFLQRQPSKTGEVCSYCNRTFRYASMWDTYFYHHTRHQAIQDGNGIGGEELCHLAHTATTVTSHTPRATKTPTRTLDVEAS